MYIITGSVTTLANTGSIESANLGVLVNLGAALGTLTNSGTIAGENYGALLTATGTVTNNAGALMQGGADSGLAIIGSVGVIDNAGSIVGGSRGLQMFGGTTLDMLTNSGTITGGDYGAVLAATGTMQNLSGAVISGTGTDGLVIIGNVGLVDNAGSIEGGFAGLETVGGTTLGTLTNSGTISGSGYGAILFTTGTVQNLSAGLIQGTAGDGILVLSSANLALLDNAGTIDGGSAAVRTQAGASIDAITNTGTIGAIVNEGTIGTGAGPAITSTGRDASIGSIANLGTINQGFQIENQDVSVGAGGGMGVFNGGTLDVVDGNLTFTDGTLQLGADVSVDGGSGTFMNQAILALAAAQNVTGNFQQTSAGTSLIELLGWTSGSYGHLGISGAANFSGGLALDDSLLPGGLTGGHTLELFGFGSYVGGFSTLAVDGTILASLGNGQWEYGSLTLTEVWTDTTMSLTVTGPSGVPEIDPNSFGSVLALVLGSLGMLERRRLKAA